MKETVAVSITLNPREIPSSLILTKDHIEMLINREIKEGLLAVRSDKLQSGVTTGTNWNPQIGVTRLWIFITVEEQDLDAVIKEISENNTSGHEISIPFTKDTRYEINKVELRGKGREGIILPYEQQTYNLAHPAVYGDEILERFLSIASRNKPGHDPLLRQAITQKIVTLKQELEVQETSYKRLDLLKSIAVKTFSDVMPALIITALALTLVLLVPLIIPTLPLLLLTICVAIPAVLILVGVPVTQGFTSLAHFIGEQFVPTLDERNQSIVKLKNEIGSLKKQLSAMTNPSGDAIDCTKSATSNKVITPEPAQDEINVLVNQLPAATKLSAPIGPQTLFSVVRTTQLESQLTSIEENAPTLSL